MSPEELSKLTPEQKRMKIAEACGYCVRGFVGLIKDALDWVPDYLNDLNAMHEAEKTLIGGLATYAYSLDEITGGVLQSHFATATQRADAFLLTVAIEHPSA